MSLSVDRRNNFDLIRLFAALQVLVVHTHRHLNISNPWINHFVDGFLSYFPGVPIFFFISGYLVYSSADRLQPNWKKYFWHRFLRIYPALWVCLIVTLLLLAITHGTVNVHKEWYGGVYTTEPSDWMSFIAAQASFFQFYSPDNFEYFGVGTPNGSLWTISVELQLYVLLAFLITIRNQWDKWSFYGGLFLLFVFSVGFYHSSFYADSDKHMYMFVSLIPHMQYFLLGVMINLLQHKLKPLIHGRGIYWALAYLVYVMYYGRPSYMQFEEIKWLKITESLFLMLTVLSLAYTARNTSIKFLKKKDLSYGIYIYHMLVVNTIYHYQIQYHEFTEWWILVVIVITFTLAYLSWHFIESKALSFKNRVPFSLKKYSSVNPN